MAKDDTKNRSKPRSAADEAKAADAAAKKRASALEAELKKNGATSAAMKEAGQHLEGDQKKMLEAAQKMAAKGEVDAKGITSLASTLGATAGLSDEHQKLLKTFGGAASEEMNMDEAAKVPGLVVDKDTGTVSVLGLINLDAKDPTSKMIANGVVAGYNLVAVNANELAFNKVYKTAAKAATHFDLTRAHTHGIAQGAATAVVAGTSFWPDINNFRQQEKQSRKDLGKIAMRFKPLLDEYQPGAGSAVDKLYGVGAQTNQMIVNERNRHASERNAERFKNTVEILGRVPLFAVSLMRGNEALKGLKQEAEASADLAKKQQPNEDPKVAMRRLINEEADGIQQQIKGMSREEAIKMAQKELDGKPAANTNEGPKGLVGKLNRDIVNGGVIAAAPIASMLANNLYNQRKKERGIQPISASDMVEHLGKQLDDNPKAERFTLPKGMSELGSKTGNNQLKLDDYLEQIFRQHERDTHGNDATIPSRFEEALHDASKLIAEAIREDKMDGRLALIKLVGEQQIVRSGGRFVADEESVKEKIEALENELFLMESGDPQQQLDDLGLSPQTIRANWQKLEPEERGFMALDLPSQVLEYSGINPNEVRVLRAQYKEDFSQSLSNVVANLNEMGEKALKAHGATKTDINVLGSFAKKVGADSEDAAKLPQVMSRTEIAEARQVVANLVMGAEYKGKMAVGSHLNRS